MKFSEYVNYFRQAAKSNKILKHQDTADRKTFRRGNIEELLTDVKTDLVDISMVLENPEHRGGDLLSDNKRKIITGAFWIIKQIKEKDFDGEELAMDECEDVSEQILAKIVNDVAWYGIKKSHPWAIKGFDGNSVQKNVIRKVFTNWSGWRTQFSINQTFANNLRLKDEDWKDDVAFKI